MYNHTVKASKQIDLHQYLMDRLIETYKKEAEKNNGYNFLKTEELTEVYQDGIKIIDWFLKHRNNFFPKKG
jgi:hypothetical protein